MTADPLDDVLRLVAEGRLTAEEAAPILAALDERSHAGAASSGAASAGAAAAGPEAVPEPASSFDAPPSGATSLRLEVREGGRQVVNLRLPIAVGRLALERVPGLSGDQVERVREALATGLRGPILVVEDGDNVVRIVLE